MFWKSNSNLLVVCVKTGSSPGLVWPASPQGDSAFNQSRILNIGFMELTANVIMHYFPCLQQKESRMKSISSEEYILLSLIMMCLIIFSAFAGVFLLGYLQCSHQTEPLPCLPASMFLECTAVWPYPFWAVLQRCVWPKGKLNRSCKPMAWILVVFEEIMWKFHNGRSKRHILK